MKKESKRIIAREGLFFIPYLFIASMFSYDKVAHYFRGGQRYTRRNLDMPELFFNILVWILVYGAARFIIWAVKILRKKD